MTLTSLMQAIANRIAPIGYQTDRGFFYGTSQQAAQDRLAQMVQANRESYAIRDYVKRRAAAKRGLRA